MRRHAVGAIGELPSDGVTVAAQRRSVVVLSFVVNCDDSGQCDDGETHMWSL